MGGRRRTEAEAVTGNRICARCHELMSPDLFYRRSGKFNHLPSSWCRPCRQEWQREYRAANKERVRVTQRAWRDGLKVAAFDAYGGRCACCGLDDYRFLTIDHVNNDGAAHRREIGQAIYYWLRDQGYPAAYQALCWNCNMAKARNKGICPHEDDRAVTKEAERSLT